MAAGLVPTSAILNIAERAADGFLPLASWLATKHFLPEEKLPWRGRCTLNAHAMQFGPFLDALMRESSGDSDLKSRWDSFSKDPLGRCPVIDVVAWRANRGLSGTPRFGITLSDAVLSVETREISRIDFYAPYWPELEAAYWRADKKASENCHSVDELGFSSGLLLNNNPFWGASDDLPSSRFAKQFVKDVLYCYLGLRGLATKPWSEAVLIELGEGRRVGNKYSVADAKAAVTRLHETIEEAHKRGAEEAFIPPTQEVFFQPVGSPPVNAHDLV